LLGIALGLDAVNAEQNSGTLSRIMAQPIHRDYIINSKFIAALVVISILFFAQGFPGYGAWTIHRWHTTHDRGVFPGCMLSYPGRIYVAFWLNLSILFFIRVKRPGTSNIASRINQFSTNRISISSNSINLSCGKKLIHFLTYFYFTIIIIQYRLKIVKN
jgi:ABC-type transport system involved in multi-copper enzyme maturation permease subunit